MRGVWRKRLVKARAGFGAVDVIKIGVKRCANGMKKDAKSEGLERHVCAKRVSNRTGDYSY